MGRVSKHKRIKSHDPFYRGPRRDTRGGVDLCPENDEQPVPKSLVRLMKRAESISNPKKKKKKGEVEESTGSVGESGASEQDVGEGRESRGRRGAREGPMFSKRKGESLKGYLERVDMESNARIMDTFRKNRKPSDRRKKRLEERRKKAVTKRKGVGYDRNKDFEPRDEVKFGEVVLAPPELKAKPRGSQTTSAFPSTSLLLTEKMSASQRQPGSSRTASSQPVIGLKRKRDLELEREHVISIYRRNKAAALSTKMALEC